MPTVTAPRGQDRPPAASKTFGHITLRALVLGVALAVVNDVWIVKLEVQRVAWPTVAAPFYNVVFTLLVICAANLLVRPVTNLVDRLLGPAVRWLVRAMRLPFDVTFREEPLSRAEMVAIYVIVSITSAVSSRMMVQILIPLMAHATFFQTPENHYADLFLKKLPKWLTVSDTHSVRNFYLGGSSLYDPVNYTAWLGPVLWWCLFGAALLFTLLCTNSILRKQWVESERLTFPIVQLPMQMTDPTGAFFRNRAMWIGFGIAGFLTLLCGLNYLWPSIPCVPIGRRNFGNLITAPPWNAIGNVPVGFYFWAIGLAFLMPLELSFSCWLFFWLVKFENVACEAFGLTAIKSAGGGLDTGMPFLNCQAYGAYLGFFILSVWNSRGYIGRVWRTAFKGTKEEDESREALSYRAAILGLLSGVGVMGVFAWKIGMPLWMIPVFFGLYIMIAMIATRIRAELGFPTHDIRDMGPQYALLTAVGSQGLHPKNLVAFTMFGWFNREYASHPAPHQLEGFKMAERANTPARQMFKVMLFAGLIAMPLAFFVLLFNYFKWGCATSMVVGWGVRYGSTSYDELSMWLTNPLPPNVTGMGFMGLGLVASLFMGYMRMHYLWFPLHPLAYAIGHSWGVVQLWAPLFIGSTIKYFMLKFGGLATYRRSLPFFFGLILGEIAIGSLWTLVGIFFNIPTYSFWPGVMTQ
jgi:hypothetical protein